MWFLLGVSIGAVAAWKARPHKEELLLVAREIADRIPWLKRFFND